MAGVSRRFGETVAVAGIDRQRVALVGLLDDASATLRQTANGAGNPVTSLHESAAWTGFSQVAGRARYARLRPRRAGRGVRGARARRIVLLGLLAWLAVPAILALWIGWRWESTA